ncbi:hypothetical protein [Nocardia miyunensis]|uniref:hypothetical protein n=1 Tax=Nocardia miyunensis TaxID=282684 RepID=UPI001FE1633E|nr:hypothetical protein [Nocardia miyunensis]
MLRTSTPMDTTVWMPRFPHDAPDEAMSLEAAHFAMQRHRDCSITDCARKRTAWKVLVAAGRIHPDTYRVQE